MSSDNVRVITGQGDNNYGRTIDPNTWYTVEVEVNGSTSKINAWVDGQACNTNVNMPQTPDGRVGVGSYGPSHNTDFDYFQVKSGTRSSKPMASTGPLIFRLSRNYPNPFNPETVIGYQVPEGGHVDLGVYNVIGQRVRTLVDTRQEVGVHEVKWDGLDEAGVVMGSGTASSVGPAAAVAQTERLMEIVRLDTVRTAGRKDSVVVHMRERVQEPTSPPLSTRRMTKAQLPAELRQADVGALKARLRPPVEAKDRMLYLGVRATAEDPRYPGERLSLAESELSLAESRQLRWDLQEVFGHWPAGSVLLLEYTGTAVLGEAAEVPLRWSFQRPSQTPPFDRSEVLASGAAALSLRKVAGEWKVSHVERLIGALHAGVVKR